MCSVSLLDVLKALGGMRRSDSEGRNGAIRRRGWMEGDRRGRRNRGIWVESPCAVVVEAEGGWW